MDKLISVALSNFSTIPSSLQSKLDGDPLEEIVVDMAALFHHYYLDTQGHAPPDPDLAHFEHLRFFSADTALRLRGEGIGTSLSFRISRSNDLGQAFCRWFLYTHLNITYFAHMHDVLNRGSRSDFGGYRVERTSNGDTPDYLCSDAPTRVYLAEAKSRREAISFKSSRFLSWRRQFSRVVVKDEKGTPRGVKGHIVAIRLASESDGPRIQSKLFAEDPASPGDALLGEGSPVGAVVVTLHYASIAAKLAQPILAAALGGGFTVPNEIRFPALTWEFRFGPAMGKRFVGGPHTSPHFLAGRQGNKRIGTLAAAS